MRKFLLVLMLAPLGLFAQTTNDVIKHHSNGLIGIPDNTPVRVPVIQSAAKTATPDYYILAPTDTYTMGLTVYDLQTNGSVARRIVLYPDGEISAVWTTCPTLFDQSFILRGTGYNHYDGKSSWLLPEGQLSQPVEPKNYHSGWPNPCIDSVANPAHEFCISHSPNGVITGVTKSTIQRIDNVTIGGNSWTQSTVSNVSQNSPLWPRVAQSGNYAYMIANYDYQESPGDTPEIKGIKDPTVYFRSTDGGLTWVNDSTLPGYDTSGDIALPGNNRKEIFGSGDNYAIDAQGSDVAIVIGGYFSDLSLWKSTDYGMTFTKTIIDTAQTRVHGGNVPRDTALHYANDGSMNVILDKNNNAHVFYGVRGIRYPKDSPTYYVHYEGYNGILHWDEKNQHKSIIGYSPDLNGNGTLDCGVGFFYQTAAGGISYEYGDDGLTSMPTSTIDANGNIYCVYSVYMEAIDPTLSTTSDEVDVNSAGGATADNFLHFRDLFVTYSNDGGATWAPEQNITKTPGVEEVYPSLARQTDGKIHLEFMSDSFASDYVEHVNASTLPTKQSLADFNNIKYMGINISDITGGNFGTPGQYAGIKPATQQNAVFSVSDIYPNPSEKGNVSVAITMQTPANASIQVYDMAGHLISEQNLGLLPSGKQVETISTKGLNTGMYFVKVNAGGYTTENKLVID